MKIHNLIKLSAVVLALNASPFAFIKAQAGAQTGCSVEVHSGNTKSCSAGIITIPTNKIMYLTYLVKPSNNSSISARLQIIDKDENDKVVWNFEKKNQTATWRRTGYGIIGTGIQKNYRAKINYITGDGEGRIEVNFTNSNDYCTDC